MRVWASLLLLLAAACGSPPQEHSPEAAYAPVSALRGDAFVADTAFLFPEVATEVRRGLLRAEFALREAARLGLEADADEVERSLAELRTTVLLEAEELSERPAVDSTEETERLEAWAKRRYGHGWLEVRAAFEQRLRRNQLYQLVVRADQHAVGGYRLRWFVCRTEAEANALADKLRLGADPGLLMSQTLLPESPVRGEPVAVYLPAPFAELLEPANPKQVLGPARMQGDSAWRVAQLLQVLDPAPEVTREQLLEGLRTEPIGAVEARAWFEEMSRRYTAAAGPLPVSSPDSAVEHHRRDL